MTALPQIQCGWCHADASDPEHWFSIGKRIIYFCPACAGNIKQVLRATNVLAKFVGKKLRNK